MQFTFLPESESRGFQLPFRRRRGRLERLRHTATRRAHELRAAAPDMSQTVATARRVVAERAPDLGFQEFLHERLPVDQLMRLRQRPSRMERLRGGDVPAWAVAAAVLGGVMLGIGVAMWLTDRRRAADEPLRALDAAADEIKAAWPELTDDDIAKARGSVARLVKTIRERTGEEGDHVRERLETMTTEG